MVHGKKLICSGETTKSSIVTRDWAPSLELGPSIRLETREDYAGYDT